MTAMTMTPLVNNGSQSAICVHSVLIACHTAITELEDPTMRKGDGGGQWLMASHAHIIIIIIMDCCRDAGYPSSSSESLNTQAHL